MILCRHYACRCARANELAVMSTQTRDIALLNQAVEVHEQSVPCRKPVPTPIEPIPA